METTEREKSLVRATGIIGVVIAVIMIISDLLLLYTPKGDFNSANYAWMASVPLQRMMIGHTLGVFTLPLYLIGFWHVYKGLSKVRSTLPILVAGITSYSTIIGTFYHGSIAYPSLLVQKAAENASIASILTGIVQESRIFNWPAQAVLLVGILLGSILFVITMLTGKTYYPKWFALFNPILLLLVFSGIGLAIPALGQFIMPAAQNISMLVFLLVSVVLLWNTEMSKRTVAL